jgi:hypothetical protein
MRTPSSGLVAELHWLRRELPCVRVKRSSWTRRLREHDGGASPAWLAQPGDIALPSASVRRRHRSRRAATPVVPPARSPAAERFGPSDAVLPRNALAPYVTAWKADPSRMRESALNFCGYVQLFDGGLFLPSRAHHAHTIGHTGSPAVAVLPHGVRPETTTRDPERRLSFTRNEGVPVRVRASARRFPGISSRDWLT